MEERTGERAAATADGYWLRTCHGFRVASANGRLGIVEDVLYGADPARPAALAVRGGLFGTRVAIVAAEDVAEIVPRSKLVRLRVSAAPAAQRSSGYRERSSQPSSVTRATASTRTPSRAS